MASERADLAASHGRPRDDWLLEHLRRSGHLDAADCRRARELGRTRGESMPRLLAGLGVVPENALAGALAEYHDIPLLAETELPRRAMDGYGFSRTFLHASEVLPLWEDDDAVAVAMLDPGDTHVIESIAMLCKKPVHPYAATRSLIQDALRDLYGDVQTEPASDAAADLTQWRDRVEDTPSIKRVNDLIRRALRSRASDIHLEPGREGTRIRFRIDGVLHDIETMPRETGTKSSARLKLISHLDVAERRLPQSGRFRFEFDGGEIDMRVSTMPVTGGESLVLRILDRMNARTALNELGFTPAVTLGLETCLRRRQGLLLVTGPTGGGKSTTLYSALQKLNTPARKLISVEDPVEYDLTGVDQIQVRPELGLGFAAALRSVLRQDPDVIMIGEIRDPETAKMAVQAALTGHLVLTTLHTNDAAASFPRLLDMRAEAYLLASTVTGVLAQRLIRRLCRHCRAPAEPDPLTVDWLHAHGMDAVDGPLFRPQGCPQCADTGYLGRTAVGEFIAVDEALAKLIRSTPDTAAIRAAALGAGMVPLPSDAARRVLNGETSMDEVLRCLG